MKKMKCCIVFVFTVVFSSMSAAAFCAQIEQSGKISVIADSGAGRLLKVETSFGGVNVVILNGTHYEMGKQYGALLGREIAMVTKEMGLGMVLEGEHSGEELSQIVKKVWDMMSPHVPDAFKEEMKGIADGAREAGAEVSEMYLISPLLISNISDMNDKSSLPGETSSLLPLLDKLAYTCSAVAKQPHRD